LPAENKTRLRAPDAGEFAGEGQAPMYALFMNEQALRRSSICVVTNHVTCS
jgi:hypothetical protein